MQTFIMQRCDLKRNFRRSPSRPALVVDLDFHYQLPAVLDSTHMLRVPTIPTIQRALFRIGLRFESVVTVDKDLHSFYPVVKTKPAFASLRPTSQEQLSCQAPDSQG
jgi:hypothetical protein